MQDALAELIELLSIVIEEKLDCELSQGLAEKIEWEKIPDLGPVYGNLFHYWADEDIRGKDSEYKTFQDAEMIRLIRHLKNEDIERACNISFLSATSDS